MVTLTSKPAAGGWLGDPPQATGPQTSAVTHAATRVPRTVIASCRSRNRAFLLDRLRFGNSIVDATRAPRQGGDDHQREDQHQYRAGGEQPRRGVLVAFALQDRDLLNERPGG